MSDDDLHSDGDATAAIPAHLHPDRTVADLRLLPIQRWIMLPLLVLLFLFGGDRPVWHNPFDIDWAIWISYAPIPILVVGCLWWAKRLSALTFFLNTTEIVLTKFGITYSIAIVLWATIAPPPPPAVESGYFVASRPVRAEPQAPPVTQWPASERGRVHGTVLAADGTHVDDALVYVAAGLEDIVSPRPAETHVLHIGPSGFEGDWSVAQRWQPLAIQTADGGMHALRFFQGDEVLLSVAVPATTEASPIRARPLNGIMAVRCVLHGESTHLAMLDNPHHARSRGGSFSLKGVPSRRVEVAAWHPRAGVATQWVTVTAGGEHAVELTLASP